MLKASCPTMITIIIKAVGCVFTTVRDIAIFLMLYPLIKPLVCKLPILEDGALLEVDSGRVKAVTTLGISREPGASGATSLNVSLKEGKFFKLYKMIGYHA